MPNARRLAATIALAVAATMLVSLPSLASAKPAPARSVKVSLVRQISKLDGQYHSLRNRVKTCPSAATDLRVAARQRTAALRGSSIHRSLANLRLRRARMAAAVVRLGRAAKSCAVAPGVTATSTALPGPTPGTALVMLPDLLGGVSLDVGPLLQGLPLGDLKLVDVAQLTGPLCASPGASCVGIDAADLLAGVHQLLGANLVASLLNLDLPATLASVRALLGADDLSGLLRVDRVSDTVVRLVPIGPLADLAALPGAAAVPIGLIDLIG